MIAAAQRPASAEPGCIPHRARLGGDAVREGQVRLGRTDLVEEPQQRGGVGLEGVDLAGVRTRRRADPVAPRGVGEEVPEHARQVDGPRRRGRFTAPSSGASE